MNSMDPQIKILQDAKDNLLESMNSAAKDAGAIEVLKEAAGLVNKVFPNMPNTAGALVVLFADLAQAVRQHEVMFNDVPIRVAYEIIDAANGLTEDTSL